MTKGSKSDITVSSGTSEGQGRSRTPPPTGPIIELRSREVIFAILIFFLLAVVVGLIVVLGSTKLQEYKQETHHTYHNEQTGEQSKPGNPKKTRGCCTKQLVDRIKRNMNESSQPCDDFWSYACGGFISQNTIPDGKRSFGLDNEAKERTRKSVDGVIQSPIRHECTEGGERKMKQFYRNCMNTSYSDEQGIEPFDKIINAAGGWLRPDLTRNESKFDSRMWKMLSLLVINFDVSALFSMNVVKEEEDRRILQFSQGGLGLPSADSYNDDSSPLVKAYIQYMEEVARLVFHHRNVTVNNTFIKHFAKNTYNFEKSLAKIQNPMLSESKRNFENTKTDISQFTRTFKILRPKQWLRFFHSFSQSINQSTGVIVTDMDYFRDLNKLWRRTKQLIRNHYLGWQFMMKFAAPLLTSQIRRATRDFNKLLYGRDKTKEEECLESTKEWFEDVVGAEYVKDNKRYLDSNTTSSVKRMIENIKYVFNISLQNNNWMDNETKEEAFLKLLTLKSVVGYPDFMMNETELNERFSNVHIPRTSTYFDNMVNIMAKLKVEKVVSLDRDVQAIEWLMSPFENNAFYSFEENTVGFPAGLLQVPFYHHNCCSYVNYGSLATTLAHEILHAFDNTGSRYDYNGNMRMWWSNESYQAFRANSDCVSNYYSVLQVDGIKVNGERTVDENMADIGGVIHAYKAYKKLENEKGREEALSGLNLTNDQVFFVAYAQNWCKLRRPESIEKFMAESFHAIERIRVQATLSQVKEFQKAFNCKGSQELFPPHRCALW